MMKKTICLILALVMAFSLCACGSNGGGTNDVCIQWGCGGAY